MHSLKPLLGVAALFVSGLATDAQPRTEIYELQERCGRRAEETFEKDYPKGERKGLEQFENHYSIRLNKCFMLEMNTVTTQDHGRTSFSKFLTLVDVNDN